MKKWYRKNKNILIGFGFFTLITFIFTLFEINLIVSNMHDLEVYATTNEMSNTLKVIGTLGLINVAMLTLWTFTLTFIILKMIFPNKRSVRNAMFLDELSFLKEIPSELRRGLDRK